MKHLVVLIPMILACSRTPLGRHAPDGGSAGAGGTAATGGMTGTGGSAAAADGAVSGIALDNCSSGADCTSCTWETSPTDSSQCAGTYCCGGMIASKKRCEANRAAWTSHCPNQFPQPIDCKCMGCEGQAIACVAGRCALACPPVGDAAPEVALVTKGDGGPYCGDGVVNGSEECDDGIVDGSYGGCTKQCTRGPHCGDGIVNGPEDCDHGSDNGLDGMCPQGCHLLYLPP
jgi:hypothetical protein